MYRKSIIVIFIVLLVLPVPINAGFLDDVLKEIEKATSKGLDEDTIVSGLKEALEVGTGKAVKDVSQLNGYYKNDFIKILMPEKIQKVADIMIRFGFEKEVKRFIKSMNRAAEKAGPEALSIFVGSIKEMTFTDARRILDGGDTAATEYFQRKTTKRLFDSFKPIVSSAMNDVGVTKNYKKMMKKYETIPLMESVTVDLDRYVTDKALEGLFYMVGEEEKKIRKDPAARVTELLEKVFSGQEKKR
jgi:hypothetical protein